MGLLIKKGVACFTVSVWLDLSTLITTFSNAATQFLLFSLDVDLERAGGTLIKKGKLKQVV